MIDIAEVQCSLNRAVSSVFGVNGGGDERDSLRAVCSTLESLDLRKGGHFDPKSQTYPPEYDFNGSFYQFLDNLRKLVRIFASKLARLKSLDAELCHLYVRFFLAAGTLCRDAGVSAGVEVLSAPLVKVWCNVLCPNGSNHVDKERLKRHQEFVRDLVPLSVNLYATLEDGVELAKVLFIMLEVLKQSDEEALVAQIIEALAPIPTHMDVPKVYPGVVSALANKIEHLNRPMALKAVRSLVAWVCHVLDKVATNHSGPNALDNFLNDNKRDETVEKTEEALRHVLARLRTTNPHGAAVLCTSLLKYDFLDDKLKRAIGSCVLETVLRGDIYAHIAGDIAEAPLSFKLILRDLITTAMNEGGNRGNEALRAYLSINERTWQLDHYLVLKFLVGSTEPDLRGMDRKLTVNKKHLVETSGPLPEEIAETQEEPETIAKEYFARLSREARANTLSDLTAVFTSERSLAVRTRALHLMDELVGAISDYEGDCEEALSELRAEILSGDMFWHAEDIRLTNTRKVKLMSLLAKMVRNCKSGQLSHRDVENALFNIIPEYLSDYARVAQAAGTLLNELNGYFVRYVRPGDNAGDLGPMIEYYTNSLIKKATQNIGREITADLVYCLTSFKNRALDAKGAYDLTVQLCKHHDALPVTVEDASVERQLTTVMYSFIYILGFVDENLRAYDAHTDRGRLEPGMANDTKQENSPEDGDGKGDFVLSIATLILTRARYHLPAKNHKLKHLALVALYRALKITATNEYIFRIRVHEAWDCLTHTLETSLGQHRALAALLQIFRLVVTRSYNFAETR